MATDSENERVTDLTEEGPVRVAPPPESTDPTRQEISVLEVLSILIRHRYTVAAIALASAVLVVAVTLILPRNYTVDASFVPQSTQQGRAGGLAQMAGQFGISVPGEDATQSPQFYADLLRSREILSPVLEDTLEVTRVGWRGDTARVVGTLTDLLGIDDEDPRRRREEGLRWLQEKAVSARVSRETGTVRLSVTTRWPTVSAEIGTRLLDLVHKFNLVTRQSQAAAERTFIEQRVADAEEQLEAAEEQLKAFLVANRQFENSPDLRFEHDRLQREVARRQQLYNSLTQAYEDARITEVRNTPLITVVEPPEEPARPDRRGIPLKALLGLFAGGVLGVFYAFGREFMAWSRDEGGADYREFHELWEDAVNDVRGVFQRRAG